ncbi:MAG: S1 RNA-binding domain-containing protein, partial [Campylobacter sp.]|nr:S1 RNA-binding domain-containing protein [Campylobacter sp.]
KDFKKDIKFEIGEEFEGIVQKVMEFGAFISLRDGVDGLLHISKIKTKLNEGDSVKVKVAEQKGSKISLELVSENS